MGPYIAYVVLQTLGRVVKACSYHKVRHDEDGGDAHLGTAKVGGCLGVDAIHHGVGRGDKELGLDGSLEEQVGQD